MIPLYRRLTGILLGLTFGLCVTSPIKAGAQGTPSALQGAGICSTAGVAFAEPLAGPHWNGWGVDPSQRRFQPAGMAQLAAEDVPRLELKWAFGFPGANRAVAQPTIVGGRIFVGSQRGRVYSLDARSGCTYWEYAAGAPVRAAIVVGRYPGGWSAYFGDQGASMHAVDALTGQALWKTRIEDHPAAIITGAPTLVGTTLFVPVSSFEELTASSPRYSCCSFRGSVVALEAVTGKLLWKSYTIAQDPKPSTTSSAGTRTVGPSGAAVWSSPTFDAAKRLIYVTTGDNYSDPPTDTSDAILAFNADTGELVWSRQVTQGDAFNLACVMPGNANCPQTEGPDHDFGSSAILTDLPAGKRALIGAQKSGLVTALDPDRGGAILWQRKVGLVLQLHLPVRAYIPPC